jgi:hypothetical protein
MRALHPHIKELIIAKRARGERTGQIAKGLGIGRNKVWEVLKEHGVEGPKQPDASMATFGLLAIDPSFNSTCLPALKQALDIVRKIALTNKTCDCAYKTIPEGSGRSLSDFLDDPSIKISYAPKDIPIKDPKGKTIGIVAANVNAFNTHQIFIRPWSCRMGRWTLAADLVHELVHLTKGSLPGDDEQLPADMEILCGVTKPQMSFTAR